MTRDATFGSTPFCASALWGFARRALLGALALFSLPVGAITTGDKATHTCRMVLLCLSFLIPLLFNSTNTYSISSSIPF